MREILSVYEVSEKYCKGDCFERLKYSPIYFDGSMITWKELELWRSQQPSNRMLMIESFPNLDFLRIITDFEEN